MSESLSKELKDDLVEDFNAVVARAENFLRPASREGENLTSVVRGRVARNLRLAKVHLRDVEAAVTGKTRQTARAADAFVHENPWQTIGAGAGVGMAIGLLIGVLFNRR